MSNKYSFTTVVGAAALISVSVGVAIGMVASGANTTLYAPAVTAVRPAMSVGATVPYTRRAAATQGQSYAEQAAAQAQDFEAAEQVYYTEAPQAAFNWAPVAALISIPAAIAAFLLNKDNKAKQAVAGVAAASILASGAPAYASMLESEPAFRQLEPCATSKKCKKQEKKEIKSLEKRQKLYEEGSAPYLALENTKARTTKRFANYGKAGLLCGPDGLPHLISDPGLAVKYGHAGETFIPTFGFIYVAGYIGTAGRTYLNEIKSRKNPQESEIIIDVPLATSIAFKSWAWPGQAFAEVTAGTLLEKDENVTTSPK
jgi:photosystem I subunit 3